MLRYFAAIVLCICLLAPMTAGAQHEENRHPMIAPHVWSSRELPAWRRYLSANHQTYHDWVTATPRERSAYWKWRDLYARTPQPPPARPQ
jgi:hypothetical protein